MTVTVAPITAGDVQRVAGFLERNLASGVSAAAWSEAMDMPWQADAPNRGFMLVDDSGAVLGAYLAFYSTRTIGDETVRICNLGAWAVQPDRKLLGVRLLKAILAQEGYHFTDLSPSGNVPAINERLGFRHLDAATAVFPNIPLPQDRGRRCSGDPAVLTATLTGSQLRLYEDHAGAAAARHAVLTTGDEWCYVMFRRDRVRRMPLFASVLHVSHPPLFRQLAAVFGSHVALRHRLPVTLAELRVVGSKPPRAVMIDPPRPRMFRSDSLTPDEVDYLYSELVCVSW